MGYRDPEANYDKPTGLTTFCTSTAMIFFIPEAWARFRGRARRTRRVPMLTLFLLALNWYLCIWFFNLSLAHVSLSTNTLLSSTSVVFSYLLGLCIGSAKPSAQGVSCLLLAMSGVMVAVVGRDTAKVLAPGIPGDTMWGEVLEVGSAMAYGILSVALSRNIRPEQSNEVWGFIGLFCLCIGSVLMIVRHVSGVETFQVPSSKALGIMLVTGFLGTSISDYVWALGLLMTTPVVALVCVNLTIPASFITDALILRQHAFSWNYVLGACVIFMGIVAGALDDAVAEVAVGAAEDPAGDAKS